MIIMSIIWCIAMAITIILVFEMIYHPYVPNKTWAVAGFARHRKVLTQGRLEVYCIKAPTKGEARLEGLRRMYTKYPNRYWKNHKVRVNECQQSDF